ncbi:MAG: ROK family glucokinase [Alkaliphilus sp.]|nr:ROK family glucokinase [Alkaliphilus sp.]
MNFIGIDLGATKIKAGIISENGKIIDKITTDTPAGGEVHAVVNSIGMLVDRLLKTDGITARYIKDIDAEMPDIKGIGIGIPGTCNDEGLVYYAPNLFWNNVSLSELLKEKINIPVFIENDATMAAIGEATCGIAKGVSDCMLITLGTGIGSGIIINNDVYSGSHGIGGEIGHMIVGENFYDCNCGNNGCLETFSSATALIKYTKRLLKDADNNLIYGSRLFKKINGDMDLLDGKLIFDCAKKGDLIAAEAVDRLVKYLAIGIGNIINILDPEMIIIGGGISKAGDYLIDKLNREIPQNIWLKSMNLTKIVRASLGNDAGIIGSAMHAGSKLDI